MNMMFGNGNQQSLDHHKEGEIEDGACDRGLLFPAQPPLCCQPSRRVRCPTQNCNQASKRSVFIGPESDHCMALSLMLWELD